MPRSRKPGEHRYRVGDTIFRVTESRNRFNRFQKSGKELAPTGFAVENYALSVHRNSRKEFQSMLRLPPYSKKSKGYRMHHLFHTIQIKLHESAGVPLISPSPLAHFEEWVFDPLFARINKPMYFRSPERTKPLSESGIKKRVQVELGRPFMMYREFSDFLSSIFATRKDLMNAIHVFFSDPAMRPLLVRMNESKDNLRKDDVRALVVFFGNEAMRYRREKRTARWPRWLSALWKRL